ncbi:MAG TPA: hypothetical protein VJ810_12500 [Blastocatellia bacterium]|nr:hypothetical protein [Blastocatellia bacterium]
MADGEALFGLYLKAATEEDAEHLLASLVAQHIIPVIKEIVDYKLRFTSGRLPRAADDQQREDVNHDALVRLLTQLRAFRTQPQEQAIRDLRGYAAVITYRACYTYLRRKYPRRHLLKNRLRYILSHQPGFALWAEEGKETIAGYDAWRGLEAPARASEGLAQLVEDAHGRLPAEVLTNDCAERRPADLLAAIFDQVGAPVTLDDLINAVARLWGIKERATESTSETLDYLPDSRPDAGSMAERREFLQALWVEISQLPARQRRALLLNLRDADGSGCIALFPLTGVATMRQIAAALEMPAEELATLWGRLPLDDLELAESLSLTRQQVINLRKAARARLARRLKDSF